MNEQQLVIDLQKGSEMAFKTLVEAFQNRVFSTVINITRNQNEAEDISQEVFIEVYQSINKFREDAKLSTWVYKIATNKSLEFLRRQKAKKRFAILGSIFGKDGNLESDHSDFIHPGVQMEQKERSQKLFEAIGKLPEKQAVAYTLTQVQGLSYQETCEVMDMSKSSVESLIFRAKGNLKKTLENYYRTQFE